MSGHFPLQESHELPQAEEALSVESAARSTMEKPAGHATGPSQWLAALN